MPFSGGSAVGKFEKIGEKAFENLNDSLRRPISALEPNPGIYSRFVLTSVTRGRRGTIETFPNSPTALETTLNTSITQRRILS